MKLKKLLFLFTVPVLLTCSKQSNYSKNNLINSNRIIGQTAPKDMVFIPGEGDIPSFYMGVSEEPNINYLIYLEWLKVVFNESYPEVYQDALPKQHKATSLFQFNDPYITSYMTHPAFSYYPVTGLTWLQIQNYLQWKTDRLNETILIENGILNFNSEQKDEDSFVTEAYLVGQYQGDTRKNLKDIRTGGERSVSFNDGILLPGFRLPTEAEWEYASQAKFQKEIDRKRCLKPFSKKAIDHPYGENYFTLSWGKVFEYSSSDWSSGGHNRNESDIIKISGHRNKINYTPDENDRAGTPKRLTSIGDFNPKEYGLINMEGNVRELVMDYYEETFDSTLLNPLDVLDKSGFKIKGAALHDENGNYVEKDSLGRMRYFRLLGAAQDGRMLEVGTYSSEYHQKLKEQKNLKKEIARKENQLEAIRSGKYDYELTRLKLIADIELFEFFLIEKEQRPESKEMMDRLIKHPLYGVIHSYEQKLGTYGYYGVYQPYNQQMPYSKTDLKRMLKQSQLQLQFNNPEILVKNIKELKARLETLMTYLSDRPIPQRLIKGGTWQNPGKHRLPLAETDSNVEVGFRCVLPYMGMPVERQYKVKWK